MSEIMIRPDADLEPVADESPDVTGKGLARRRDERGLVSAEWVLGIVAAAALAGVLFSIITTGPVEEHLVKVVVEMIERLTGLLKQN